MIREEVSDSIPIDLIIEILSRLPAKSIARFGRVSKLWRSMLFCPRFNEMFLTRSLARTPRLLFAVERFDDWCFFTSPQPPYDEKFSSSLVVAADFHMKFPGDTNLKFCGHISSFIHLRRNMRISEKDNDHVAVPVICNPSTGQYTSLPLPKGRMKSKSFLGFDPVDKQFKVLSITLPKYGNEKLEPDQILTLGTTNDSWREIYCPLKHSPSGEGICINGFLYYFGERTGMIVCFDVRSEKFKFIDKDFNREEMLDTKLIDYKGKLGVITLNFGYWYSRYLGLEMWVINDVEKPQSSEWSILFSFCWYDFDYYGLIVGVTATDEIVLSSTNASKPFYVFFFDILERKSNPQRVEIQGFGFSHFDYLSRAQRRRVKVFLDHVEDLEFITMKSTSPPPEKKGEPTTTSTSSKAHLQQQDRRSTFESINKFDSLSLLDE